MVKPFLESVGTPEGDSAAGIDKDLFTRFRVSTFSGPPEFYLKSAEAPDKNIIAPLQSFFHDFQQAVNHFTSPFFLQGLIIKLREKVDLSFPIFFFLSKFFY